MIMCSDPGCVRVCEFLFPPHEKPDMKPVWSCGLKPLEAKFSRVGQQKHA